MTRLFVDLDGVLADFDTGHEHHFGIRPCKKKDDVNWKAVRETPNFYRDLPPMADFETLWAALAPFKPTILTGVPRDVPEATENKRAWVTKHLGDVPMIGCRSVDKCLHGQPGDILIDDWEKHRALWEGMGGHWITHVRAADTIVAFAPHHMNIIRRLSEEKKDGTATAE